MKRTLFAVSLLAVLAFAPSLAPAQDPTPPATVASRFSLSSAFDLKGKAAPVVVFKVKTFTESALFGNPKLNLSFDLDTFMSATDGLKLGLGVTHTFSFAPKISREFQPQIGLTLGAWSNYGTGAGKLTGGPYVGLGIRF